MPAGPIVFYDSGVGGLPYLDWVRTRAPEEDYLYVADTAHFPYGEKPPARVRTLVLENFERIIRGYDPVLAVIACNTASVTSLAALRDRFSIPFVGVVPAVKPAAELSARKKVGVLATSQTVEDEYTHRLIEDFAADCDVVKVAGGELVSFVQNDLLGGASPETVVKPFARIFAEAGIDQLVLGCTHFTYLDETFRNLLGPTVTVVDSREGVGRQVLRLLPPGTQRTGTGLLVETGEDGANLRGFADRFGLTYAGRLPA